MDLSAFLDEELGPNPNAPAPRPKPDQPGYLEWDGTTGYLNSGVITGGQPADFDALLTRFGLDPDEVMIVGHPQLRMWDVAGQPEPARYYRISIAARLKDAPAMPNLDRLVKRFKRAKTKQPNREDTAKIVCFSDLQAGKSDHRGGSQELIDRTAETFELLSEDMARERPATVLWADVGDVVEEFNSGGGFPSQATSNDLSLMDQLELAATIEAAGISRVARYADEVIVAGVGSNHCRWRAGKSDLGNPADDWGLFILKQIQRQFAGRKKYRHVRFVLPEAYTEHVAVDIFDTRVGIVHGHQARQQNKIGEWWGKQSHGGSSLGDCDLLIAGHYHNYATYPSGRSAHTGREKRVYVCPTLDNGSSWFRNGPAGSDSDPGLLTINLRRGIGVTNTSVLRPGRWQ